MESDVQLIEQYRAGDNQALAKLVNRYAESVRFFVTRLVGKDEADDVAQESFVKAWKNLRKFNVKKSFKVWLFTIARNTSYDYLRKHKMVSFSTLTDDE